MTRYPSGCAGKFAYDSARLAHQIVKRRRRNESVYRCEFCGHWHVGNQLARRPSRTKIRREIAERESWPDLEEDE